MIICVVAPHTKVKRQDLMPVKHAIGTSTDPVKDGVSKAMEAERKPFDNIICSQIDG